LAELGKTPPTLYVVRENPKTPILGYICFWLVAEEIQLLNLAIHPNYRRQGVGRYLMEFLLQQARGKKVLTISLEVRPSNQAAQGLYRSLGFRVIHRRPGYYGPEGEDALVMEWST
jgi:[ribosomal protein S18]-alanine N-acetyltransferase